MAINRRLIIVIVVAAILAVMATLLLIESQKGLVITPLSFTTPYWYSLQFDKDYLNITVKNTSNRAVIISEVNVSQIMSPHLDRLISTYEMFQSVSVNEQVLIRVRLNWTSDYAYFVELMDTDGYIVGMGAKP